MPNQYLVDKEPADERLGKGQQRCKQDKNKADQAFAPMPNRYTAKVFHRCSKPVPGRSTWNPILDRFRREPASQIAEPTGVILHNDMRSAAFLLPGIFAL
jgi:hypothetical protein